MFFLNFLQFLFNSIFQENSSLRSVIETKEAEIVKMNNNLVEKTQLAAEQTGEIELLTSKVNSIDMATSERENILEGNVLKIDHTLCFQMLVPQL